MASEPYYNSGRQRLYKFANGHGASVVDDGGKFRMAAIRPEAERTFWLNYNTPFGPPKTDVSPDDVEKYLDQIESFPPFQEKV